MAMLRVLPVAVVGLALALCGTAATARQPRFLPLANGNRWTLRDLETRAATTVSVRTQGKAFVLRGFPGTSSLRVRRVQQNIQAWDRAQRRWESFLRLGARAGTRYGVDLGDAFLWQAVEVRVASKRADVRDYHGKLHRGCVRFTLRYRQPIADAGLEQLSFAPGIGLVRYSDTSIGGPRTSALGAARIKPR